MAKKKDKENSAKKTSSAGRPYLKPAKQSSKSKSAPEKKPKKLLLKKTEIKEKPAEKTLPAPVKKEPKKAKKIILKTAKEELETKAAEQKKLELQKKAEQAGKATIPPKIEPKAEAQKTVPGRPAEKPAISERPIAPAQAGIPTAKKEAIPEEKIEVLLEAQSLEKPKVKKITIDIPITVKDLAAKLEIKPNELMKIMIENGVFATINQGLDEKIVNEIARICGVEVERLPSIEDEAFKGYEGEDAKNLVPRAPVVTLMGHVDHGKTSLLDTIRKTKVAAKEYGGITQHIGAYEVMLKNGAVTFLDTPGHEAFTKMRARGANATDVVVLVVAADDGVMPQTIEAIDHARAAEVPIIVALNKCDLPHVDVDRVKNQLAKYNLLSENWGGKTIVVEVSAKTGKGIDTLLEMLLLEAEMLELKANPKTLARGVVIESELSRGRGVVATVLVQNGTLHVGDIVIAGLNHGKIKAMINDKGQQVSEALPSMPIAILGLSGVPHAGEKFFVVKDERKAREYCMQKLATEKERELVPSKHVNLTGLYLQIEKGQIKELKIIVKGDVSGSIEALEKALLELSTKDVKINVIHTCVGNVNDADVVLAHASNAIIIGFHVRIEPKAQITAEKEGVEIKLYNIIYEATADVQAAMEGMLEPIIKEVFLGRIQVRQIFANSKVGTVAGCYVVKGKINRAAIVKLIRDGKIIYEGKISSLKRFKDDVREVAEGFECGLAFSNFNNIREGDTIEAFEIQKIARRLEGTK